MKDILVFIFAATDTTSKGLCSIFLYLSRHPEIRQKLESEIDDVIGAEDYSLEELEDKLEGATAVDHMEYLGWFIKEVLRISPPLPATVGYKNASEKDVTLDGDVTIRAGEYLAPCPLALHYDPNEW